MIAALRAVVTRDLRLGWRAGGGAAAVLVFFLMTLAVVPFAVGPDRALLARVGIGTVWMAAFLASLLGLDRLFAEDVSDGSTDLDRASLAPLPLLVLAKVLAHWLATGLPLSLAAPVLGVLVALPPDAGGPLVLSLLVGTPALAFSGAVGAALAASLRLGGVLAAVLVLPGSIPVLIFGVAAATPGADGATSALLILLALTLTFAVVGCTAAAAALRSDA